MAIVLLFGMCAFTAAIGGRLFDPLTTIIARDFSVEITTAALLTSAYALPFALGQPLLGPIGDTWGKARLLKTCMWVLTACLIASVFAPTFAILFALRFAAGFAGGGIVPSSMAMLGDRFVGNQRQLAISRFSAFSLLGQIITAAIAGIVAELIGWRPLLAMAAAVAIVASLTATIWVNEPPKSERQPLSIATALFNYGLVFSNPRAYLCYAVVFLEGLSIFGAAPFIAAVLESSGRGGPAEAGIVLGGFAAGGLLFALTLQLLLMFMNRFALMTCGGFLATSGFLGLAIGLEWQIVAGLFAATGFGFMMLHNSIQTESVDIAPTARSSAYSMHAFFFFTGQALGPIVFGLILGAADAAAALYASAAIMAATGLLAAILFAVLNARRRKSG